MLNVVHKRERLSEQSPISSAVVPGPIITGPLGSLPTELLFHIFSKLDRAEEIASFGIACKKLHLISNDSRGIWKSLYRAHFPCDPRTHTPRAGSVGYLNRYKNLRMVEQNFRSGKCRKQLLR